MIELRNIRKTFKIAKRSSGLVSAVKHVFKREYSFVNALDGISFEIPDGEIVGYIGPNGAGKSTTIKIMCGILRPDGGDLFINDAIPWKRRIQYVHNIGVVFGQRSQLWWDIPAADSFDFLKDLYKIPAQQYKQSLDRLVSSLELSDIINTPVRQLSLGQRMKCEIAASLLHSPQILFLDEPTIGLDAVSKLKVRQFIREINSEQKITVILTTHDMQDIEALTNRVMLIGKGRILYDGLLTGIREKFSGEKIISVEYGENPAQLILQCGDVLSFNEARAEILLHPGMTTVAAINEIAAQREIRDFNIKTAGVEEVIANMYKEMNL